jgi:hypothetical protein
LEYIEIIVVPSSFPVSYRGEFHYRSGATKQQLTLLRNSLRRKLESVGKTLLSKIFALKTWMMKVSRFLDARLLEVIA